MFDVQYVSETVKAIKRLELLNLEQDDMNITNYEQKSINLLAFYSWMQISKETKVSMFQGHLNPRHKGMVSVQRLKTLRDVVNATRLIEQDSVEA